jgi:hypothetical protein
MTDIVANPAENPMEITVVAGDSVIAISDAEFADQLETLAREIERLERDAIIQIAAQVAKGHELFLHHRDEGGFRGWVEDRLQYSRAHAYRLLNVNKIVSQGWDTFGTLPVSAIYLLAAPSTPDEVRNQVAERVKAGEKLTCAKVTEAIAQAKNETSPSQVGGADHVDADAESTPAPSATEDGEDPSIAQRRAEHQVLFTESSNSTAAPSDTDLDVQTFAGGILRRSARNDSEPKADHCDHEEHGVYRDDREGDHAGDDHVGDEHDAVIRNVVLLEFFAQASGADIYDRIPAVRRAEVIATFLDRLTVQGMCEAMSPDFKDQLRDRLPLKRKPYEHTLNLEVNPARNGHGTHSRQ